MASALALLVACTSATPGQLAALSRDASTAPAGASLPVDTEFAVGTLQNGMRYYVRTNHRPEKRAELRLVVKAGSVMEDDDQRGFAHLLEHMAFNGSTHFAKSELVSYLESIGMNSGEDLNATTAHEQTIYSLTIPTDAPEALERGLLIIEDWVHGITLDQKAIDEERGVVLAERRARLGAGFRIGVHTDSVLLGGSRYLDRNPLGVPSQLETAQREDLLRFYSDWYRPDRMAVVVVGDVDSRVVERMIRRRLGAIPAASSEPRPLPDLTNPQNDAPLVSVVRDPEFSGWNVQLLRKYQPEPVNSEARARADLVEALYTRILDRRLRDVARHPDAPFVGASTGVSDFLDGLKLQTVINVNAREGRLESGFRGALTEVERIAQHGITDAELDEERRTLERQIAQARLTRDAITSASYAAAAVGNFVNGNALLATDAVVERNLKVLASITRDDVSALARQWHDPRNLILIAVLPEKEGVAAPDSGALLAVLDSVSHASVSPYQARVVDAPLIEELPVPGRIVKERTIAGVGITEWTLSNGARVLVKPTDFNPDQVLFTGYGWGGMSRVARTELPDAQLASALPAISGLGTHGSAELQREIAGKLVTVGMKIDRFTQGINGSASARDLETLLQLVYLHFTAPRIDSAAVRTWRQQLRSSLGGRSAIPDAQFGDTLSALLTQRAPRAAPLRAAQVDSIDAERALAIYRDRFADASDFTFVLVGKVDLQSLRPLVARYLGSLPSLHRENGWVDHGIRSPEGVVDEVFRFGAEPRGRTAIVFSGPFNDTIDGSASLNAMATVLRLRLRDRLREQLGGTYTVNVQSGTQSLPESSYRISVEFDSAPERVEEMVRAVFDEVAKLRDSGPTVLEVQKVREESLRQLDLAWKDNGFWLQRIVDYTLMERPLEEIAAFDAPFRSLGAKQIHAMARKYLDVHRYVRVTRLPATTAAAGSGLEW
jgi:zinc protease